MVNVVMAWDHIHAVYAMLYTRIPRPLADRRRIPEPSFFFPPPNSANKVLIACDGETLLRILHKDILSMRPMSNLSYVG